MRGLLRSRLFLAPPCRVPVLDTPATRTEFWQAKFDANVTRDRRDRCALLDAGWRVATVWECALKNGGETEVTLAEWLRGVGRLFETGSGDGSQPCP